MQTNWYTRVHELQVEGITWRDGMRRPFLSTSPHKGAKLGQAVHPQAWPTIPRPQCEGIIALIAEGPLCVLEQLVLEKPHEKGKAHCEMYTPASCTTDLPSLPS